jgi:hypothetical protein
MNKVEKQTYWLNRVIKIEEMGNSGYWNRLISNILEDKRRYEDSRILHHLNRGLEFEKAKDMLYFERKRSVRRFDPDMKPWKPSKDFPFKTNRLSPEMISYLSEKKRFIPKSSTSAAYKGRGNIPAEVKAARDTMIKDLVSKGFAEDIAKKMSRVIK